MARRPGVKTLPLSHVERTLRRERTEQRDVYAPLSALHVRIEDPLAPGPERFRARLITEKAELDLRFTPTSLAQLCNVAGVPSPFLERLPPALGLNVVRCLVSACELSRDRMFLFRLKGQRPHLLRAILPQSYVRLDDLEVLSELVAATRGENVNVVNLTIHEDVFFLRAVFDNPLNLGSDRTPDPGFPGIDVITSETGTHALEVRQALVRVVCTNGLTTSQRSRRALRTGRTRVGREVLQASLRTALHESLRNGLRFAETLADTRSRYIRDPREEIDRVFREYRLGSSRGRLARRIAQEVLKKLSVLGLEQFEFIQCFTAVARECEPKDRLRLEDAMGTYLLRGAKLN